MGRTDRASLVVGAEPARVFAALTHADALVEWLPPAGMTGRFERFDARPGGGYRLVLSYDDASSSAGKSAPGADVVEVRYVELIEDHRLVEAVDFVSDDPRFVGTMTMTWRLVGTGAGTRVDIIAENVPSGIAAGDHAAGMHSSLENLALYLAEENAEP